jgi:hypothetical protein
MKGSKFKVGQVVRINTDWYTTHPERVTQIYQRVTRVWAWNPANLKSGFGVSVSNGDQMHEKYLKPLTKRERGV